MLEQDQVERIVEAALMAADQPLTLERLLALFGDDEADRQRVRDALSGLEARCLGRGFELKLVASGYRFQVRQELSPWISRMWEERPPRYSRALMETLALIAYKQPVTRGDIEEVRGVSVSSNIMRTLLERDWIRVVGYREVPGRPAIYATTKAFLDYFNLQSLDQLPPLAEIRALTEPHVEDLVHAGPEYAEGLTVELQADPVQEAWNRPDAVATRDSARVTNSADTTDTADAPGSAAKAGTANARAVAADDAPEPDFPAAGTPRQR
jgi:segregation and condensation protein B